MVNHEDDERSPARTPWPKRVLIVLVLLGAVGYLLWDTFCRRDAVTHTMALRWSHTGRPLVVEGRVVDETDSPVGGLELYVQDESGGAMATTDASGRFETRLSHPKVTGLLLRSVGEIQWGIAGTTVGAPDASEGLDFHIIIRVRPPAPQTRPATAPSTPPG